LLAAYGQAEACPRAVHSVRRPDRRMCGRPWQASVDCLVCRTPAGYVLPPAAVQDVSELT
jgi:hypothetical protein